MNITTERLKNVSFLDSLNVIFIMTLSFIWMLQNWSCRSCTVSRKLDDGQTLWMKPSPRSLCIRSRNSRQWTGLSFRGPRIGMAIHFLFLLLPPLGNERIRMRKRTLVGKLM